METHGDHRYHPAAGYGLWTEFRRYMNLNGNKNYIILFITVYLKFSIAFHFESRQYSTTLYQRELLHLYEMELLSLLSGLYNLRSFKWLKSNEK